MGWGWWWWSNAVSVPVVCPTEKPLALAGMTETQMIASNPYNGPRIPGSVGPSLPDVHVRVVDDEGNPCATNEVGMIQVQGPNVFKGYWKLPDKTRQEFTPDGWFTTGDLGRLDQSSYLYISGRHKDLIISGGLNVYPKEVELVLDSLSGVSESAVIGLPHSDYGEAVFAVLVMEDNAQPTPDLNEVSNNLHSFETEMTRRRQHYY